MVRSKITYPPYIKLTPTRPFKKPRKTNRMRVRPPPILIPNPSIGTHHTMVLVEAWQWIRTIKPTHQYIAHYLLLPDPMPDPQLAPSQDLLSLCFLEHPEGIPLVLMFEYTEYYNNISTHMRRPEPHEYSAAIHFFRMKKRLIYHIA